MRGTLVCGVSDNDDGRAALEMAVELSDRLGLRLVLAHARDGIGATDGDVDGAESVSMKANREGAARLLARLAAEYGVADSAERRSGTGDAAHADRPDRRRGSGRLDRRRRADARPLPARPREPPRRAARKRDAGAGPDRAAATPGRENGRMNGGQR